MISFQDSTTTPGITYFCESRRTDAALTQSMTCWRIFALRASDNKKAYANGKITFTQSAAARAAHTYTFI